MSSLVVVSFPSEELAYQMRAELVSLQKQYLIEMEDVVIVTKDADGKVKLHQPVSLTALGAVGGGFWGMLLGMLFLSPLLGLAVGAGAGALSGKLGDIGIDDQFMRDLAASFQPGTAAVFVLVRQATNDKVLDGLRGFAGKGRVLQTSLSKDEESALRQVIEGGA